MSFKLIPKLIQFAKQKQFPQLKLEACWALASVTSQQSQLCQTIVQAGGLELFVGLLREKQQWAMGPSIWGIGNLAAENVKYRNRLLKYDCMKIFLEKISDAKNQKITKDFIWVITNLCRGKPKPKFKMIQQALPILCKALKQKNMLKDENSLSDIFQAISIFTENQQSYVEQVNHCGVLDVIFKSVLNNPSTIQVPALKIIGDFSSRNQNHTDALIKEGIFSLARKILDHPKIVIRKQICYILSNIAAGNLQQLQAFLNQADLLQKIANLFVSDDYIVKRQIGWIYSNFTNHSEFYQKSIEIYVHYHTLKNFSKLLNQCGKVDEIKDTLSNVYTILSIANKQKITKYKCIIQEFFMQGGGKQIEDLKTHNNNEVSELAEKISNLILNSEIPPTLDKSE